MERFNPLPTDREDIHPWMPMNLHSPEHGDGQGVTHRSNLARQCEMLGVSIHDREKVYELNKGLRRMLANNP